MEGRRGQGSFPEEALRLGAKGVCSFHGQDCKRTARQTPRPDCGPHCHRAPSSAGGLLGSTTVPGPEVSLHTHPPLCKGKPVPALPGEGPLFPMVLREQAPPPSWAGLTQVPQAALKARHERAHVPSRTMRVPASHSSCCLPLPPGLQLGTTLPLPTGLFRGLGGNHWVSLACQQHLGQWTGPQ